MIQGFMKPIKANGIEVVVYECNMQEERFFGPGITHDLIAFRKCSDVILTNRSTSDLDDDVNKVFTHNLFGSD